MTGELVPKGMPTTSIDILVGIPRLQLSDPPSDEHAVRLAWCERNGRHTRTCNWWMAEAQRISRPGAARTASALDDPEAFGEVDAEYFASLEFEDPG